MTLFLVFFLIRHFYSAFINLFFPEFIRCLFQIIFLNREIYRDRQVFDRIKKKIGVCIFVCAWVYLCVRGCICVCVGVFVVMILT